MQRRRVLQAVKKWQEPPPLPRHALRAGWLILAASAALTLCLKFSAPRFFSHAYHSTTLTPRPDASAGKTANLPLEIAALQIEVLPPNYTGKFKRVLSQFDLEVEVG